MVKRNEIRRKEEKKKRRKEKLAGEDALRCQSRGGAFSGDAFGFRRHGSAAPFSSAAVVRVPTLPYQPRLPGIAASQPARYSPLIRVARHNRRSGFSAIAYCDPFTPQMASRSPTVVTPLPKLSSAPETPAKETTTTTPQAVPFPPPQTFDIIPPLHGLLLRLLSPSTSVAGASDHAGAAGPQGASAGTAASRNQQQQQSTVTGSGNNNHGSSQNIGAEGSASMAAEIAALGSNAPPPLDIKDLPTEASSIKIRIQKAQAVVEGLPDVQRSVGEQDKEIEELEDQIARLQSVISEFGKKAGKASSRQSKIAT